MRRIDYNFLTTGRVGKCNQLLGVKYIKACENSYLLSGDIADGYCLHFIKDEFIEVAKKQVSERESGNISLQDMEKEVIDYLEQEACCMLYEGGNDVCGDVLKTLHKEYLPIVSYQELQTAHEDIYFELLLRSERKKKEFIGKQQNVQHEIVIDCLEKLKWTIKEIVQENRKEPLHYVEQFSAIFREMKEKEKCIEVIELASLLSHIY